VLPQATRKNIKQRDQIKSSVLDQDQYGLQRSNNDDGGHDLLQPNIKLASLKEQSLFYGAIPDDDPIGYHDMDVRQGSPKELVDSIECFITSAEQTGMSRDGLQSLRQFVAECKDVFRLKLGTDPPVNMKPLVIKLHEGAEPVRISARKYALPQLNCMSDKIRELEELGLV
jgi:hypothetical protein